MSGKAELDTLAIQDLLEAHGFLASIWSVEDVQSVRPDLTDEQCRKVLRECSRRQDAEAGINWGRPQAGNNPVELRASVLSASVLADGARRIRLSEARMVLSAAAAGRIRRARYRG